MRPPALGRSAGRRARCWPPAARPTCPRTSRSRPTDALDWTGRASTRTWRACPSPSAARRGDAEEILGSIAVETLEARRRRGHRGPGPGRQPGHPGGPAGRAHRPVPGRPRARAGWPSCGRSAPARTPSSSTQDVRDEDLEENGIVWLPPAPADAGLGVVAEPEVAEDLGIGTLSDLATALSELEEGVVRLRLLGPAPARPAPAWPPWPTPPTSASGPAWSSLVPRRRAVRPDRGRAVLPVRPGRPPRPPARRRRPRVPGGRPRRLRRPAARGHHPGGHLRPGPGPRRPLRPGGRGPGHRDPAGPRGRGRPGRRDAPATWPGTGWSTTGFAED